MRYIEVKRDNGSHRGGSFIAATNTKLLKSVTNWAKRKSSCRERWRMMGMKVMVLVVMMVMIVMGRE